VRRAEANPDIIYERDFMWGDLIDLLSLLRRCWAPGLFAQPSIMQVLGTLESAWDAKRTPVTADEQTGHVVEQVVVSCFGYYSHIVLLTSFQLNRNHRASASPPASEFALWNTVSQPSTGASSSSYALDTMASVSPYVSAETAASSSGPTSIGLSQWNQLTPWSFFTSGESALYTYFHLNFALSHIVEHRFEHSAKQSTGRAS
jgi:hypothetical protein